MGKSCIKNRGKVFEKLSALIEETNATTLCLFGVKLDIREEYEINNVEELLLVRMLQLSFLTSSELEYSLRVYRIY